MIASASKELIAERVLQERVDTKFVFREQNRDALLTSLDGDYAVVLASGQPDARYETVYFDTDDYLCLREHHRGRRARYKVRIRHHVDRSQSFLEVKEKRNNNATFKYRLPIPFRTETLDDDALQFIAEHARVPVQRLQQSIRIHFRRMTLVGIKTHERITLDTQLWFSGGDNESKLSEGVIAEVKQGRFNARSPIIRALRGIGAMQLSVSKYCTAAQLLLPSFPLKRYRPRLRLLRTQFDG